MLRITDLLLQLLDLDQPLSRNLIQPLNLLSLAQVDHMFLIIMLLQLLNLILQSSSLSVEPQLPVPIRHLEPLQRLWSLCQSINRYRILVLHLCIPLTPILDLILVLQYSRILKSHLLLILSGLYLILLNNHFWTLESSIDLSELLFILLPIRLLLLGTLELNLLQFDTLRIFEIEILL